MIIQSGSAMPCHPTTRRAQGFSLVELMIVLAIIAIVAAIAIPDYQSSMAANREISASNNLLGAMQFARSEAVTRRTGITVCASSDGSSCGASWSAGGIVRTNAGVVLRTIPAANDVTIAGNAITFRGNGTSAGGSITVGSSKTVSVSAIGYAKIE
ncbi:GspH/FimT family pseudopilin [Pseudomonas sp. PDM15]|uniref:GspH/FimT family pseudopilin n=1 Tax=Pseudomonas sp. PDM15 TaxID=2769303 RepID=UPI001785A459|nr:GspH/FimT family pseudopilin [Pseudomonas sp. PDM15]MBD9426802.1 GspH/FimT family pseudopilin [Pseudomonas sp. PDM15]